MSISDNSISPLPTTAIASISVIPALACRSQLLPLISRKLGSLTQFLYRDIGQVLCSAYSGCVPGDIMSETRALFFGMYWVEGERVAVCAC